MINVFIDGKEGTTGLKLYDRLSARDDVKLLVLSQQLRKDINARKAMLNLADVVFLCLPDDAAKEAVSLVENASTRIIDASSAHRTEEGWAYGFAELDAQHRAGIVSNKRVAVPGCHASGFLSLIYPLVKEGIAAADYPFAATSITGYSGGGKKMIAQYEAGGNSELESPRQYAIAQAHKHLKEMTAVAGLNRAPLFQPYVANFYSGMEVSVGLFSDMLLQKFTVKDALEFYTEYYKNCPLISVVEAKDSFIAANKMSGLNDMKIIIGGNDERVLLTSLFDNLCKGASGAAVECFNLMTGKDEAYGLI